MPASFNAYDRTRLRSRILHLGPGAFFRAHQMDYYDRLNREDGDWGVTAISLHSRRVAEALNPQGGLYTLVLLGAETQYRTIGALQRVLHGSEPAAAEAFLSPDLQMITLTITEKGYCLTSSGQLDLSHPDIQADLSHPDEPKSAIGWIVRGLKQRREQGLPALVILSCDNLPDNGEKLKGAVLEMARRQHESLAGWIAEKCPFPGSMVDSITPATDEALITQVETQTGISDNWPIQREPFTDWVIEKTASEAMPPLEAVGATFTDNVAAYEQAKLRMLNGSHSTLTYYGLAHGFDSVAAAMSDDDFKGFVHSLLSDEIIPSLPKSEIDLAAYRDELIARFVNPGIVHKLSQIAWDGSKKLPIRLLPTISENLAAGRPIARLCIGVASWWRFVIRQTRDKGELVDPMTDTLRQRAAEADDSAGTDIPVMLSLDGIFPTELAASDDFRAALSDAYHKVLATEQKYLGGNS